jgi:hypothetical protein
MAVDNVTRGPRYLTWSFGECLREVVKVVTGVKRDLRLFASRGSLSLISQAL